MALLAVMTPVWGVDAALVERMNPLKHRLKSIVGMSAVISWLPFGNAAFAHPGHGAPSLQETALHWVDFGHSWPAFAIALVAVVTAIAVRRRRS